MGKARRSERGLLSLEACIAVTIFMFLMLFMYSFFVVFEARNAIGHAILSTANSLALDAYGNSNRASDVVSNIFFGVYGSSGVHDSGFVDTRKWYDGEASDLQNVARTRFLAYLGGGDRDRANQLLERYHIQGGAEGLNFSDSKVDGDKRLHLVVTYTIEYEFQVFNLDVLEMQQKACSKLWT